MKFIPSKTALIRIAVLLGLSVVVTSFVIWEDSRPDANPSPASTPARHVASEPTRKGPPQSFDLSGLDRARTSQIDDKLFYVPPPPPPPPRPSRPVEVHAPPPKPTAPPLPFKFVGKLVDQGVTTVFVSHNGQSLSVKQGDTVAGSYRVDQVTPTQVVFTYIPLEERQILAAGKAN